MKFTVHVDRLYNRLNPATYKIVEGHDPSPVYGREAWLIEASDESAARWLVADAISNRIVDDEAGR